jgi:PPM family protein phosphatase
MFRFFRRHRKPELSREDSSTDGSSGSDRFAAMTDPGIKRTYNEDSCIAREFPGGLILLAVADGVGGAGGGDVASAETIKALSAVVEREGGENSGSVLAHAFDEANRAVRERAAEQSDLRGMASTLVAALVQGAQARVANLGDSRAYLLEDGNLRQLTADHSWVEEQVKAGVMSRQEAERSQYRNVITRGIGTDDDVQPDQVDVQLSPGSVLLLCSDGLFKPLSDEKIGEALAAPSVHDAARRLINLANAAGGPDNIAVAILKA